MGENKMSDVSLLDGQSTGVPGQAVFPGMQVDVGHDSIVLETWQEKFCWQYVENGGVGYRAYLVAKPKVKESTALAEASKLLTLPNIIKRIDQIRAELSDRCRQLVITKRLRAAAIDRREFLKSDLKTPKNMNELSPELASIVDLEYAFDRKGKLVMIPSLMSMERGLSELSRIGGLYKDTLAVTGKDGGPISIGEVSDIELSNRLLTLISTLEQRANGE